MSNPLTTPRWHEIILELYRNNSKSKYCQKLGRRINGSLTHVRNVVNILESRNLIRIIPLKKIKMIELTDKGKKVAEAIFAIKSELN
ncbi:MAG: hypothetical protein ACTSXM_06750 [Promethearchaeota archaeon]